MPKYVHPSADESLEAAIDVLGNRVRVAIIGYLRTNGPTGRQQLEDALGIRKPTLTLHLSSLVAHGVLVADPPLQDAKGSQKVRYSVNESRVRELIDALLDGLHELR
jgi:DNA-binding transcriptional ArsR family regulator